MNKLKVLSLFDGISCGRVALERAGFEINQYYASEIDKYAIQVAQKNYPDTIQLGDVTKLTVSKYDGYNVFKSNERDENGLLKNNDYNFQEIDLLIGGSPCQGFSFAGKQLNFDDPRSALFFEFVRILKEVKPKYFLLENVRMKQEYQNIISEHLGVKPIKINSNLVSAQNRIRLYWTNIPNVTQPIDRGILLKDILLEKPFELFSDKRIEESKIKTKNYFKWDISGKGYYSQQDRAYYKDNKMCCIPMSQVKSKLNVVEKNGVYRRLNPIEVERLQTLPDNYTEGVSNTQRYKALGNGWTVDVLAHIFKNISYPHINKTKK